MKWGWFVVVILLILNGVIITAFVQSYKEHQAGPLVSSVEYQEKDNLPSVSAKHAENPEQIQPAQSVTYTFRKTNWGMSVDEVKSSEEGRPIHEREDMLLYPVRVSSYDASCGYLFSNGKLFRATYIFDLKHTNKNDYIADYENIKKLMTDKYGEPKQDEINWKNNLYQSDVQQYGFAVSLGHLVYYSIWETVDTNIILELTGDNYEINVRVSYWSKDITGNPKPNEL